MVFGRVEFTLCMSSGNAKSRRVLFLKNFNINIFNCFLYFLDLFFWLPNHKTRNYQFPISTQLSMASYSRNWFP